ncbi:hypothetical protein KP509_38G003600 [Ceratopteris richardii]|uniref:MYB transcription factor n=1 Tax=Ceratopteris richardii TaxID=49495 RepID=A0A8T2Q2P5_CERRI|nr:hypothetical protein KP509_38G003600 [Ceratopteris richardii]
MGAPKQKWTSAEEAALRAGVKKHGLGKWRAIQKDPEFTFLLATRSNVDLKDKWRNMNIGVAGYVSREKSKSSSKIKAITAADEPISPLPLALISGDTSAEDSCAALDAHVSSESPREAKALGPRFAGMVIDAIADLNSPSGVSSSDIASTIEIRDNYKVNSPDQSEGYENSDIVARKRLRSGMKDRSLNLADDKRSRDDGVSDLTIRPSSKHNMKNARADRSVEKAMLDVDYARFKLKTAEEAARAAAVAMAEAEAAAAAAEKAAKKAKAAEAEAEAAEIAAEVAALAARPPRKARTTDLSMGGVAVAV